MSGPRIKSPSYDALEPAQLVLRTTAPRRALWARAAAQRGVSLQALAEHLLDEATGDLRIGETRRTGEPHVTSPCS